MNLLRKGFDFLFPMSADEEQGDVMENVQEEEEEVEEKQVEQVKQEVSSSDASLPPSKDGGDGGDDGLEIEEEKDAPAAPVVKKEPKKKRATAGKKRVKKEEEEEKDEEEKVKKEEKEANGKATALPELDPFDLSDNKAAKRIALASKATFKEVKLDARTRQLHVMLPGSNKPKIYPYIDFADELIPAMQKLVDERPRYLKGQLCLLDCANHSPRLFWNAIHLWKSTDALEQELQKAGLTTVGRRTRRKVANA